MRRQRDGHELDELKSNGMHSTHSRFQKFVGEYDVTIDEMENKPGRNDREN